MEKILESARYETLLSFGAILEEEDVDGARLCEVMGRRNDFQEEAEVAEAPS